MATQKKRKRAIRKAQSKLQKAFDVVAEHIGSTGLLAWFGGPVWDDIEKPGTKFELSPLNPRYKLVSTNRVYH
jgi:hypothetical protein